jgi:hypothetical protein
MDWDEVLAERVASGGAKVGRGVSEREVTDAEAMVGSFPDDYRVFLSRFGYAAVGADQVFGLGDDVPKYLDVVAMTVLERRESPGLPAAAIVIFNDGGGNLTFLAGQGDGSSKVFVLYHDDPAEVAVKSSDFSAWLTGRLDRR